MSQFSSKSLSVIIPAYNVGPFIVECIHSITTQKNAAARVQAIVVVDGATDDTLQQARKAALGHEDCVNIVVQENAGLSAARNTGLTWVKTDYVTFLDGDDIWLDGYLDTLLPLLDDSEFDLIEYDAMRMNEAGNPLYRWRIASAEHGRMREVSPDDFMHMYRCYSWARIFRTWLVRGRPFPVGRRYEDSATTPWYYWHSQRRLSLGIPLIGYRVRASSILATPRLQDIDDIALTTREAAAMYVQTHTDYWQRMTHRSFQQAISRIALQPIRTWAQCLRASRAAVGDVPAPTGLLRTLNLRVPLLYTTLLMLKNKLEAGFLHLAPPSLIRALFSER